MRTESEMAATQQVVALLRFPLSEIDAVRVVHAISSPVSAGLFLSCPFDLS